MTSEQLAEVAQAPVGWLLQIVGLDGRGDDRLILDADGLARLANESHQPLAQKGSIRRCVSQLQRIEPCRLAARRLE